MTRSIPPVRRLLMDAKALIAKPENWCRDVMAKSAKGRSVAKYSPRASQFCCLGAIWRFKSTGFNVAVSAEAMLRELVPGGYIAVFNDATTTTHPMVMRLFNKAIRRAKEQGI